MSQKLAVACAGLGRMGKRHALHFLQSVPRASLVAVSTPDDTEVVWAQQHLVPFGVTVYKSYTEMLQHPGLQAVVIASITSVHAEQAIQAIEADKHVLCEKPLSTSVEVSQSVVDAAKRKPHLKVMCGFSRRFDDSYRDAWRKMDEGLIGRPSVFRSQTCDKLDPTGFFVAYAEFSGGIFVDCNVHDMWVPLLSPADVHVLMTVFGTVT
jgi:myo-inositol 2-dehydrogenase / D-chiro-inositol 1-dehydrogenase